VFGYYRSRDEWVLRPSRPDAQRCERRRGHFRCYEQPDLSSGVPHLCRVWQQVRREGNRTPQIAFLAPFYGDRANVVKRFTRIFTSPGLRGNCGSTGRASR
jgi:hypothetical protein